MTLDFSQLAIPEDRPIESFNFTYNLMRSFIENAEETISNSIQAFEATGPQVTEIEICAEENIYQYVEHYMGLDNGEVVLDDIFSLYFPSLQRRSSFLTLFGTYEHEIDKFCVNFAKKEKANVSLSDFKGSGLTRAHLFIRKVVGLSDSQAFSKLKNIVELRNACAHNDARYVTSDGQKLPKIIELMTLYPELLVKDNNEVLFKNGFLLKVLHLFDSYIQEIEATIKLKNQ